MAQYCTLLTYSRSRPSCVVWIRIQMSRYSTERVAQSRNTVCRVCWQYCCVAGCSNPQVSDDGIRSTAALSASRAVTPSCRQRGRGQAAQSLSKSRARRYIVTSSRMFWHRTTTIIPQYWNLSSNYCPTCSYSYLHARSTVLPQSSTWTCSKLLMQCSCHQ